MNYFRPDQRLMRFLRRYGILYDLLDENDIALTALQLLLLTEMEPLARRVLEEVFGAEDVTIEIAGKICRRDKETIEIMSSLREAYERAEKSNMILLFDEADALLGKRSEVKDARDKYANTEGLC